MKILVDTSVWIDHLKYPVEKLIACLQHNQVLIHSAVVRELACGNLKNRSTFLADLALLPFALEGTPALVMELIERNRLYGKGLGWVDMQLLASAKLSGAMVLSHDRQMTKAARSLGIG